MVLCDVVRSDMVLCDTIAHVTVRHDTARGRKNSVKSRPGLGGMLLIL